MYCKNCGKPIPDNTKFCPYCGTQFSSAESFSKAANDMFNSTEKELGSAINEVRQSFNGSNPNSGQGYYNGEKLKDDRGLISYILLNLITCGIYGYYFLYKMAHPHSEQDKSTFPYLQCKYKGKCFFVRAKFRV